LEGVVLTDAELDHTLGLILLREARYLQIYATSAVRTILEQDSRILPVTGAFAELSVPALTPGARTELGFRDGEPSGIVVEAFPVPAGPPRFASTSEEGHTVGLMLEDRLTGGSCAFVPGCGGLSSELLQRLGNADLVLFDGTFWSDQELIHLGIGDRSAREMDHLPVSGPGGSLDQLAGLSSPQKVYTHINNTNPMLLEDSPERSRVEAAGASVGFDGMSFVL
jgi:pyrroloquinoline quinone biosynthesis protein B